MRPRLLFLLTAVCVSVCACAFANDETLPRLGRCVIITPENGTALEKLAAREVRRYVYLRTGQLLPIGKATKAGWRGYNQIIIARKDRPILASLSVDTRLQSDLKSLDPQQYLLKTVNENGRWTAVLSGGDDTGTLYAAYRFAEHLGIRFYLHGDVIPDRPAVATKGPSVTHRGAGDMPGRKASRALPPTMNLDERAKPLFETRGIQPFHDFPEGPDWWNRDDYRAILSQLPKLRMNFFGLHTYPEGGPNAEPTVWIGLPEDIGEKGQVKSSYPSSYQNTLRGNWGYKSRKTSDYDFGGGELFERDDFGADVMSDLCPQPSTPETSNELFHRTGTLLRDVFAWAHELGIKTCVGTETPLTVPKTLRERLQSLGLSHTNSVTVQKLYEGIFKRITETYPIDYYWFWTPETWTWEGAKSEQVKATTNDLVMAINAAKAVNASFQLATCGWVLGPPDDRGLFDKFLPKDWPVSCINREVGKSPVEPSFAKVSGRPKWAIPWLEDDPGLTSPQLWVGRMRQDAVDALQYGCNGLMGIHWRTRVLGPNVSALAQAAWTQSPWHKTTGGTSGWVGGKTSSFPTNRIENTEDATLYQTVRYGMSLYRLVIPNGSYGVTLKFCEPHFEAEGKRVFGVKLQGSVVLDRLDIFAKAGKNKAIDFTYNDIKVTDGYLDIEFERQVESPAIAALAVQNAGFVQKINCGGPAYKDYSADLPSLPRYQPTLDFYRDWTSHEFGASVAEAAAGIFERIDGKLPCPSDWVDGPGGLAPDSRAWTQVREEYAFVDELAALRSKVVGAGNRERFDYWLNTFRYLKAIGQVKCVWAEYNKAMEKVKAEKDVETKKRLARENALPLRLRLVQCLGAVYDPLLATVSNPGEMGTVANWEQHIQPKLISDPGKELAKALGESLPSDAQPPHTYKGAMRVIVPCAGASVLAGEGMKLKVIILARQEAKDAALYWRPLGSGRFARLPLSRISGGVYTVDLPANRIKDVDFEYYVKVESQHGTSFYFPATAPGLNQTVVVRGG